MFIFILEILLEGPQKGFFDLPKNPCKEEKKKQWQEAQKAKGKNTEKSTSTPDIPPSPQHAKAPPQRGLQYLIHNQRGNTVTGVQTLERPAEWGRKKTIGQVERGRE
jgi:hypothetical protein